MTRKVFVFGSNLAGIHGAGSAREACKNHGALWGCGIGPQENSYAIPTKDEFLETLLLDCIRVHVKNFLAYARDNPDMEFNIVAIGCGLAGYTPKDIAPMFAEYPPNCILPAEFLDILPL